ncbi:Galactokinase [Carabus blaptoides fortunei]
MALPLVTIIVGRKINSDISTVVTTNPDIFPKRVEITRPLSPGEPKWANYIRGVMANYLGTIAPNFEAVIVTTVPTGGGLSSSASLEVAMYTFLDGISNPIPVMPTDKALACQKAEHNYAGVPCGIMDQFISTLGKKNHVLLIDCRSLSSTLIPFTDPNIVILITNSNVKHELGDSEYATRRKQCQQAALLLKKFSLRDANIPDIEYLKSINADEDLMKRARHAITEILRTEEAAQALKDEDFIRFGKLMIESHMSLKNDFEVSCKELDELVDAALQIDGVLGSRMTGGGFGGCTVTMVYKHAVEKVMDHIKHMYKGTPTFYICSPSDGARLIDIEQ